MTINFGLTAIDYAKHRAGFPPSFFAAVKKRGIGLPNQNMLDLGTGTGTLARGFAQQGCVVTALDPAAALMAQGRQLDETAGVQVDYRVGRAEKTGMPASTFDIVTAGQCWHWFDGPAAAQEIKRILAPNGKVVIAHFDWIPLKGNVVEATECLILAHNPQWHLGGGNGLYPLWLTHLGEAGFNHIETFSFDTFALYTPEDWRGRIRASAGIGATLPPAAVAVFDVELKNLLETDFPAPVLQIHHRVFVVMAQI